MPEGGRPTIRHLLILNVVAAVPLGALAVLDRLRGVESEIVAWAASVAIPTVFSWPGSLLLRPGPWRDVVRNGFAAITDAAGASVYGLGFRLVEQRWGLLWAAPLGLIGLALVARTWSLVHAILPSDCPACGEVRLIASIAPGRSGFLTGPGDRRHAWCLRCRARFHRPRWSFRPGSWIEATAPPA